MPKVVPPSTPASRAVPLVCFIFSFFASFGVKKGLSPPELSEGPCFCTCVHRRSRKG